MKKNKPKNEHPQQKNDLIILNRPRQQRRGLTINRNGRITLRSLPCKLLGLSSGDKICFGYQDHQLLVFKSGDFFPNAIPLSGRKGQLHGCSKATVNTILLLIPSIPASTTEIDLVVSSEASTIEIDDCYFQALTVINRADPSHCR